jgi:predicted nuclease with TOPRIM domain
MVEEVDEVEVAEPDEQLFTETPDTEPEPYPHGIGKELEVFTTPIDPDVQTILGQLDDRTLILNPDFQRLSVWKRPRQSRLIESLLLNIPVPPCYFAEDVEGTRVVVDGQQRLRAIEEFQKGQYKLTGLEVRDDLNGKRWVDLDPKDARRILRRVFRTIVITHYSDPDIKFEIFRRLNTGGVPLTEQEIRNAIYRGSFNRLLDVLAHKTALLEILKRKEPDNRLRHHELVLRYFALRDALPDFRPPLKRLLNSFMERKRDLAVDESQELERRYDVAIERVKTVFGRDAFRRYVRLEDGSEFYEAVVSRAVYDLQMIGLGETPREDLQRRKDEIREAFQKLSVENDDFIDLLSRATDHRSRFYQRMRLWAQALSGLDINIPFAARIPPEG